MSARPWLPLYGDDYIGATADLSLEEHGLYLLLLMRSWRLGPLPADEARLARLVGWDQVGFQRAWPRVRGFWTATDAGWVNPRLEAEREAAEAASRRRADAARVRWRQSRSSPADAMQALVQEQSICNASVRARVPQPQPQEDLSPTPPSLRSGAPPSSPAQQASPSPAPPDEPKGSAAEKLPRGTRLPADWTLPEPWRAWALQAGMPPATVDAQVETFRDYWHARAGPGARKVDWQATWRNWVRRWRELQHAKGRGGGHDGGGASGRSRTDRIDDLLYRRGAGGVDRDAVPAAAGDLRPPLDGPASRH